MHFTSILATAALAFTASAAPAELDARAVITSGSNTPGSIFQFGNDANCRKIFYQSGACGLSTYFKGKVDPNMPLIAMPSRIFDKFGQAQDNSLCGHVITMTHKGVTRQAVVADENTSDEQSIDMCLGMWQSFGGHDGDGTLIKPFTWSISK